MEYVEDKANQNAGMGILALEQPSTKLTKCLSGQRRKRGDCNRASLGLAIHPHPLTLCKRLPFVFCVCAWVLFDHAFRNSKT